MKTIQFRHEAYVNWLKQTTYPQVAIKAIQTGTLAGCWESLIGAQLLFDCMEQNKSAFDTMEDLGFDVFTKDSWLQAGRMILNIAEGGQL